MQLIPSQVFQYTDVIFLSIFAPPHFIKAETKKNRAPRPIADAIKKGKNAICKTPAPIVNTLYGIGEKPAKNTTQTP